MALTGSGSGVTKKRVAVIGAGASGLSSIKACLDEDLEPVCFERTGDIGGLWYYTPEVREGVSCVMKSTVINTSKEIMSYSDFPIPQEFPNFMHNTKVLEYFRLYANHFNLLKHIRFNTTVLEIKRSPDFNKTGRWTIKYKANGDGKTDDVTTEVFDAVLLCTGHHADKNVPRFEGDDVYKGKMVHPHDYKDSRGYEDKTVVIIGIGNSAGDVAVELSHVSKQVYLSTRRGTWVINRIGERGYPTDMIGLRRSLDLVRIYLPSLFDTILETRINMRFDHVKYGLRPAYRASSQHPMVNDELPNRIACGSVIVKPDIKRLTKTGVEFVDGTVVENVDLIVTATGYVFGFPYLEEGVVKVEKNVPDLYRLTFPPNLAHNTLAVIGCFQPIGAVNPPAELQSRWATRVFKGLCTLPSESAMWNDIYDYREETSKKYCYSLRHTIEIDFIPFMDQIAAEIGCKPDIGELLWTDPILAFYVFFGTCTPYQYRLRGPNAWPGARKALLTQWDRVLYPLKSSVVKKEDSSYGFFSIIVLGVILLFIFCFLFGFF